jgi:hypothetical protein
MDRNLFQKIITTFGTQPLAGSSKAYAKILLHPGNAIGIYIINAGELSGEFEARGYAWNSHLHAWVKTVATVEDARQETSGLPVTAAALSQIQ